MAPDAEIQSYLAKALETLAGAESERANGRYNNAAKLAYYACFQSAVAALLQAGIRPPNATIGWGHAFVQSRFAGQLVQRRKLYPAALRDTLSTLMALRHIADYETDHVSRVQAERAVRRAREFVTTLHERSDRR